MLCGTPQGSVLGAILFLIYGGDLQQIIEKHVLRPHLYADDSQIYGSCGSSAYPELLTRISACIDDMADQRISRLREVQLERIQSAMSSMHAEMRVSSSGYADEPQDP